MSAALSNFKLPGVLALGLVVFHTAPLSAQLPPPEAEMRQAVETDWTRQEQRSKRAPESAAAIAAAIERAEKCLSHQQALGLKNGDRVKVSSSAGSLTVPVRLTHGLHPKVVALPEGLGHWELGKIARAKKYKSSDFDTHELWWEEEGNGVHANTVIPAQFDPAAGGAAWNDSVVSLSKV